MKKKGKNYYLILGIIFGLIGGVFFAVVAQNMAFVGIGLPIGIAVGVALDERNK